MEQFEYVSLTGHVLSPAEQSALFCALPVLADEYKRQVQFWGKVMGTGGDYLIVQANGEDLLATPTTLYSMDGGLNWNLLHPVPKERAPLCEKVIGYYRGDPAYEYRVKHGEKEEVVAIKESERLAHFVGECDFHCAVVPRGALRLTDKDTAVRNRTFQGLTLDTAGKLHSYCHRRRTDKDGSSLLHEEHLDRSLDFMPALHHDLPQGVWVVKSEPSLGVVYGQSLLLRGSVFFHCPGTPVFGYFYLGHGEKNRDLPFML
eukprot:Hpha_TRINITY_DN13604_c0_g1::TRINITY_DN13604_c0_g1_i1::g.122776::m.122776/K19757/RSPH9; radial spoke head protein 9